MQVCATRSRRRAQEWCSMQGSSTRSHAAAAPRSSSATPTRTASRPSRSLSGACSRGTLWLQGLHAATGAPRAGALMAAAGRNAPRRCCQGGPVALAVRAMPQCIRLCTSAADSTAPQAVGQTRDHRLPAPWQAVSLPWTLVLRTELAVCGMRCCVLFLGTLCGSEMFDSEPSGRPTYSAAAAMLREAPRRSRHTWARVGAPGCTHGCTAVRLVGAQLHSH
jgi:hypothetical protein